MTQQTHEADELDLGLREQEADDSKFSALSS